MPQAFLQQVFGALADHIRSEGFHAAARHADHPQAFSRHRILVLPVLVGIMLGTMRMSVQAELDQFFAAIDHHRTLLRRVSEQAFAKARSKLSGDVFAGLNDWLIEQVAEHLPRWHGLRLVAADASTLRFSVRKSHAGRSTAEPDQIAFGLYLPQAEMMLATSLHSIHDSERQMLVEHLDRLGPGDLLLLDRGYPARWLIALLVERGIAFCMRADSTGFAAIRRFMRAGPDEQVITLSPPKRRDIRNYRCQDAAHHVRLIRQVSPSGQIRVLITNLFDATEFPVGAFGDLYHQRWRIEECYKRLKHRLALEQLSGLTQLAALQDFGAKILADNLQALCCLAAREEHEVADDQRINRTYAFTALKRVLPALLIGAVGANEALRQTLLLIADRTHRHRQGRSRPRIPGPKPHPHSAYRAC